LELVSVCLNNELESKGIKSVITSPGNVFSGITSNVVHPMLILFALYFMRLFGCSGINISGENAATSAFWVSTVSPKELDPQVLYHSEINQFAQKYVRKLSLDINEQDLENGSKIIRKLDLIMKHSRI
jgi:hypothetical protein